MSCNVRREVHEQRVHIIARVNELLPAEIAWEVVEAVGHIRSALDKMMVALVEINGFGTSGIGFPFGGAPPDGEPEEFPHKRHKFLKKKLTDDQWDLVLRSKPYPGGNKLLWAVNELANEDKHRKDLVRVIATPKVKSMTISNGVIVGGSGGGNGIHFGGDPDFVCEDLVRDSLWLSYSFGAGSVHPQIDQTVMIALIFGRVGLVTGYDVLETFAQQIVLVEDIIKSFGERT